MLFVALSEVHVQKFEKKDGGVGASLKARVVEVELISGRPAEADHEATAGQTTAPSASSFASLADDIPF